MFIVRVELHSAEWSDYDILHKAMAAQGFTQTIKSDADEEYHLPMAEYSLIGNFTRNDVLAKAQRAATQTRRTHGILVSESNGCSWVGLPKVRQYAMR